MPKQRSTCTRCSMKRQKCDRLTPCSRCVQNGEGHLCTTQWKDGYDPAVHRKYPRKSLTPNTPRALGETNEGQMPQLSPHEWPSLPLHLRSQMPGVSSAPDYDAHDPTKPKLSTTNIDFVTYGRSEALDISMGTLVREKEDDAKNQAIMNKNLNQSRTKTCIDDSPTNSFSPAAKSVEVYHLQALLPSKQQVLLLADYHGQCMNYWTGGLYHAPSFRRALLEAYGDSNEIDLREHDWRWLALLFSILSGAILASPEADSVSWGFSIEDKLNSSRTWGNAIISCLQLGDYASSHHIYSVQAILEMHTSAHLVGSTKEWAVYQAAAIVIARGLGLHKLGPHPDDGKSPLEMNSEQKDALLQREIGRRIWLALTAQDWLCSTSQGMYTLQKRHYSSIPPAHFDEETMEPILNENTPAYTHCSRFLHEIAYNLVRYLDDMLDAPDLTTKYHVVLKYDAIMRALPLEKVPRWLDSRNPHNPDWPRWAIWARRSYQASCAHKIIMVHQSFLGRSFKDSRFTYSRWACLTSSKTIIDVMEQRHPQEPQWWVEQAFVVTAGLCLGLDLYHRSDRDAQSIENRAALEKAVTILQQWPTSSVAAHGVRLITSLLQEHTRKVDGTKPTARPDNTVLPQNVGPLAIAHDATEASYTTSIPAEVTDDFSSSWANADFDVDMLAFENLLDTLPMPAGVDSNAFFESMLTLPSQSFY